MNIRVLLGIQSAKGVAATEYKILPATSSGMNFTIVTIQSEALDGSDFIADSYAKLGPGAGDIPQEISRDSLMLLLELSGFTGVDADGDMTFKTDQTWDLDAKYGTLIVENLDAGLYSTYKDVLVNTLNIEAVTDAMVKSTGGFVSGTLPVDTAGTFSGSVTAFTGKKIFAKAGTVEVNEAGTDIESELTSFSININNNLEVIKSIDDTLRVKKAGKRDIKLSFSLNEFSGTSYAAAMAAIAANTESIVTMKLATVTAGEDIDILFPRTKYENLTPGDLEGTGSLVKDLIAFYDTTDSAMKATFAGLGTP